MSKAPRNTQSTRVAGRGPKEVGNSTWPPVPREAISKIGRPSTLAFRKLAAELVRANQAEEAGTDQLQVILKCLVDTMGFLDADLSIRGSGLTRPLGVLAAALRDLKLGASPALFFNRPKKGGGRPKGVSIEAAHGAAAAALSVLIQAGESRDSASQFVAEKLAAVGVKSVRGKPISARQVLRWREEIGGRASQLAESTYNDILKKYATVPREVLADQKRRRDLVEGAIMGIRSMGF
jgi:hypothetical protein